ncbi:hypothetical protein [Planomonospora algeriensis]
MRTARRAIHAMPRATADEITRPDTPHYCMLILAAPSGAVENHAVQEFLADLWRDMLSTVKDRLARGVTDGDLTAPPAGLDAITRYRRSAEGIGPQAGDECYTTVVQGLSVQARDGADHAALEAVITCAMAAWDTLTSAPSHSASQITTGRSPNWGSHSRKHLARPAPPVRNDHESQS